MSHPAAPDDPADDLTPFLDELTAGLAALDRFPEPLVELLAGAGLSAGQRVLDVGCGRGAAAVALAVKLGVEVDGVDAVEAFVLAAEARARPLGVPCHFRTGDAREAVEIASGNPRDALIAVGLGRSFGPPEEAVALLRLAVRPGGLLLLEDGFVREGASAPASGHEAYRGRAETISALIAHGDLVIGERVAPEDEVRAQNEADLAALRAGAAALRARRPGLSGALDRWLEAQVAQAAELEATLRSAAWLIRRGD